MAIVPLLRPGYSCRSVLTVLDSRSQGHDCIGKEWHRRALHDRIGQGDNK